jgi:transposase
MRAVEDWEAALAVKFGVIFPHLDERQRRLLLGAEARVLGRGGITIVARAAGVRAGTVSRGVAELESGEAPLGRTRRPGGGRKRLADLDRGLRPALLALIEPDERGDPMTPLRWTTKSTRTLAAELTRQGHRVSAGTVAGLLHEEGFSLQGNAKTLEGAQHPDRDAQFGYLNERAADHQATGDPVVSVDAKKKELIGAYGNRGRQWRPAGQPAQVNTHDFPDPGLGKAIPYGIYDLAANTGWVNVGTDHDTAAFAVASLRAWWDTQGAAAYPQARRLLITADAGGSNSYRTRAWKTGLAAFAADTGLAVTVCHFPPGTSKWNKIEHRLFSRISHNWRGRPLTSHQVVLNTIAATTTSTGLRVRAELDDRPYPLGTHISDEQLAALPLTRHHWHGDWNYTLRPEPPTPQTPATPPAQPTSPDHSHLTDPAITGIPTEEFHDLLTRLSIPHQAQREARLHNRRGHPRRNQPHTGKPPGKPPRLTPADRLLATILNQRHALPHRPIAALLGVHPTTISRAINETRQLLTQTPHTITPTNTPLTPTDLTNLKPAS